MFLLDGQNNSSHRGVRGKKAWGCGLMSGKKIDRGAYLIRRNLETQCHRGNFADYQKDYQLKGLTRHDIKSQYGITGRV